MTQVIGLFGDQVKAQEAVEALRTASLGDTDVHVVEEWDEEEGTELNVAIAPNPDSGMVGLAAPDPAETLSLELSDEEATFFKRGLKKGGVLVVVELADDARLSRAMHVLKERGGRVASEVSI